MAYNPIPYGAFVATLERIRPKGGRKRWRDLLGNIYEWDSRHCELERYDRQGRHNGVIDPETGRKIRPKVPGRRTAT